MKRVQAGGRAAGWCGVVASGLSLALATGAEAGRGWIENPTGRSALQVYFRSTPTYDEVAQVQAALTRMAAIVCDATEGQVRLAQVRLVSSPADQDVAGLWLHDREAASGGPYDPGGTDLRRLGAHMDVFASARLRPDRLAHLFAHHAFGLGDQYDDQRRRGEACGVGPGFERSRLNEENHSIMQAAGAMRCGPGPSAGLACERDDQCAGTRCEASLASEFSLPSNHDLRRGDGRACPRPTPLSRVRLVGRLPARAEPLAAFDPSDYLTARATSVWQRGIEVLGESGTLPGVKLRFWLSHTSRLAWQLSVGADGAEFGGTPGSLRLLKTWSLTFREDFSLAEVSPADMRLALPPTEGRGPVEVAVDLGTRSAGVQGRSGEGYDGLQMVAAGQPAVELVSDGVAGCTADWCASSWNEDDSRWETAEQTLLHRGASDWQTIVENHPFLSIPAGGVLANAPATCAAPPEFLSDVMGTDQVVLVLDTSRSMGLRADGRPGEVCGNGADDDGDGQVDEADCADSRLEYEVTAARAFVALAASSRMHVGIVAMDTDAEIVAPVDEAGGARSAVLEAVLGSLQAEGDTAIGTALEKAQEALLRVERTGRSRSVVLVTDGANNIGPAPGTERRLLDPLRWRVFPVGIGYAADTMVLSAMALRGGGTAFWTRSPMGTPAVLAELAARHAGSAALLPRTAFEVERRPGSATSPREFGFEVEERAGELVVFLASRNARIDDWGLLFELAGPGGRRIDERSPEAAMHRGFVIVRVSDPEPGPWKLRVLPARTGLQRSELLAWTTHPEAGLFVDADPRLASVSRSVRIAARPVYGGDIDGEVSLEASVRRPDGNTVELSLERDPFTRAWRADFDSFAGRGFYEVRVGMHVGRAAQPALGEPVFDGPARPLVRVVPFSRVATTSFFVGDGGLPACDSADCDEDGLADKLEAGCVDDVDGDGMPSVRDADSDNDELFDGEEGLADLDKDGRPDFCDPETTPASLLVAIEAGERALETACAPGIEPDLDSLRASIAAVRRIVQALRVHDRIPPEQRDEFLAKLGKAAELKKQAAVIGAVLPEFCGKYQSRLKEALAIERDLRVRVDPWLLR